MGCRPEASKRSGGDNLGSPTRESRAASRGRNPVMFKSLSTSLVLRGILAVAVGIMALAWPQVTVLALVILFAVYAFIAAGLEAMRAFSSPAAGDRVRAPAPRTGGSCGRSGCPDLARAHRSRARADRRHLGGHRRRRGDRRRLRRRRADRGAALFISAGWCRSRSAWCCSPAPA